MTPNSVVLGLLGYRPSLDGLRGIAMLAVMAYHSGIVSGGYLGVDVFFSLSGFLITTLLTEEWNRKGSISFRRFYIRRAVRLLPALFSLIVICSAASLMFAPADRSRHVGRASAAVMLYVANWALILGQDLYVLNHTWSLAIEEQFYLAWPVVLAILLRVRQRGSVIALPAATILVATIPLYRMILGWHGASLAHLYLGSDTRADSVLIGCVAGFVFASGHVSRAGRAVLATWIAGASAALLLACLFFFAVFPNSLLDYGANTLAAGATALLILELMLPSSKIAPFLGNPPLVGIGRISYGLYLWHFPVFFVLGVLSDGGSRSDPARIAAAWLATFTLAAVSYRFLERPLLESIRRVGSSGQPARS